MRRIALWGATTGGLVTGVALTLSVIVRVIQIGVPWHLLDEPGDYFETVVTTASIVLLGAIVGTVSAAVIGPVAYVTRRWRLGKGIALISCLVVPSLLLLSPVFYFAWTGNIVLTNALVGIFVLLITGLVSGARIFWGLCRELYGRPWSPEYIDSMEAENV